MEDTTINLSTTAISTTATTTTTTKKENKTLSSKFKSPFKSPKLDDATLINISTLSTPIRSCSTPKATTTTTTTTTTAHPMIYKKITKTDQEEIILKKKNMLLHNELVNQIKSYERENNELKRMQKFITNDYSRGGGEGSTQQLIKKWRSISQMTMSYLLNSISCKIDKMGGYEEFIRKEFNMEKQKLEYHLDDGIRESYEEVMESEEFQNLNKDEQLEYQEQMENKLVELENFKTKQLERLENEFQSIIKNDSQGGLDMKQLAKRLKVDYSLVFPSEDGEDIQSQH
ncbi:Mei5p NDAI_0E02120 [Naumovozyma dairenensis CBS 421]|uniref:Meiosis protein 5 n=1 Tax=Naumovozyma dairenensis (strain ATCC 10597 / BCRC 20456 / CBS 421 / NBRC 0211 / NRRL Y-12639) TaxID=1071378 RepID=G0WBA9_NAUDC|nr:hypothetical protein NDAI_0E02120 [Naumovozyma dairenensis CBS 421]CCD25029.1 hypothetical protein NDAI_0E02120 [Naumovozyma dairenensis CBS 421]